MTRRRLSTVERRTQLVLASCAVIARNGLRGLRVEEVAAEADVSTTLLYHHFTNRAGLLRATLLFVDERAGDYTEVDPAASGFERLAGALCAEFQDEASVWRNSAVWNEFRSAAVFDPELRDIIATVTGTWHEAVVAHILGGQRDGSIARAVDPAPTAERLTALVEGLSNRWLAALISTEHAHCQVREAVAHECLLAL